MQPVVYSINTWYTTGMKTSINTIYSLSKYLAHAGIASRRKVVDLILSGVVMVNDTIIKEPGAKVIYEDKIRVNGEEVKLCARKTYVLLNKPKNCVSTVSDELDRQNVVDFISSKVKKDRVYPVGRLDRDSTGLLVLTNDGDLALRLSHPRYNVKKVYHVKLETSFTFDDMQKLLQGVELKDGQVTVDEAYIIDKRFRKSVGVVLHSGKNRVVRRIFAQLGHKVKKLDRVYYAGLTKKDLTVGQWRYLTSEEVTHLKKL